MRRSWLVALALASSAQLLAQSPSAPAETVEADPIRCWWRTSTGAVRVGEPFSLVLTCAVVENATTTVVPDQSRLEPSAMQLPPFEVIGGQREPDLRSDQRRFFQYQYQLRLISGDLFGKDARIPSIQVTYHLESRVQRGDSVKGRDHTYVLPTESVRVLSLVPADATDIRDLPSWTLGDIEWQRFRARVFFVAAGVLLAAGGLVVFVAIVRLLRRGREAAHAGRRLLSDTAVLRGAGRELAAVRRASQAGWNPDLMGRALAALRVAGTIGLGGRAGQIPAPRGLDASEGQMLLRGGFLRGKRVLVSGAATTAAIDRALSADAGSAGHRHALTTVHSALQMLTAAQFGREAEVDETELSRALAESAGGVRRLRFENAWAMKKLSGLAGFATELGERAWSR